MTDVNNSMSAEISDLIVFNLFSGYASLSPSSHYRLNCANETVLFFLCCTDLALVNELDIENEYKSCL